MFCAIVASGTTRLEQRTQTWRTHRHRREPHGSTSGSQKRTQQTSNDNGVQESTSEGAGATCGTRRDRVSHRCCTRTSRRGRVPPRQITYPSYAKYREQWKCGCHLTHKMRGDVAPLLHSHAAEAQQIRATRNTESSGGAGAIWSAKHTGILHRRRTCTSRKGRGPPRQTARPSYKRIRDASTIITMVTQLLLLPERGACMSCGFHDRMTEKQPRENNGAGDASSTPGTTPQYY